MKRQLLTLLTCLMMASVALAESSLMRISYCESQLASSGTPGFNSSEKGTWVSGAIYVPAGQIAAYAKNRVEVIRVGLASKLQIDTLRVWVRTSLDGENLAQGTLLSTGSPKVEKGWNDIALDDPYVIPEGSEGIYLGFSYHQKSSTYAMSVIKTITHANALLVQLGSSAQWVDRSDEGVLSLEGMVGGDYLPKRNLTLESVSVPKFYGITPGKLEVTATVRNNASETITGYQAICRFEGYDETCVATIDQAITYEQTQAVKFTIRPTSITQVPEGPVTITVTLDNLNEGEDENMADNTTSTTFQVMEAAYPRKVLLEEFTTEQCPNCPRVAGYIHSAIQKPEFADVITMEHHSGYYTDFLTTSFDKSYLWFYNDGGSTYAPAVMYDRTLVDSETTPVSFPESQAHLEYYLTERLQEIGMVGIDIEAYYREDGQLAVSVTGQRAIDELTKNPARITVFLVEDKITARSQSGASGTFIHYNVGRDVNETWGVPITWNGNKYAYECAFAVADTYVKDNLAIIAVISDFDANDPTACGIVNTEILRADQFGKKTEPGVKGDVTGDGNVDVADINAVINVMLGKATNDKADVTGDNQVDVADINAVINIMLGKN